MATTEKTKKEDPMEVAIKAYLDGRAESDELFAKTYAKENKSIAECCKYIRGEAKKLAVNNCAMIDDATVYGWAVHYYDEDDIKVEDTPARVATSKPVTTPKFETVKPAEPAKPKERQLTIFDFL